LDQQKALAAARRAGYEDDMNETLMEVRTSEHTQDKSIPFARFLARSLKLIYQFYGRITHDRRGLRKNTKLEKRI
jgi:hypothetical protein